MKEYKENLKKYAPRANPNEPFNAYGWAAAETMVKALDDMKEPTRDALMDVHPQHGHREPDAAARHQGPDGRRTTAIPSRRCRSARFNGQNWELQGDVIQASAEGE